MREITEADDELETARFGGINSVETIEFQADKQTCRFYDPTQSFEPTERIKEIRKDPLTQRTSHILGSERVL